MWLLFACTGLQTIPDMKESGGDSAEVPVADGDLQASTAALNFGQVEIGTRLDKPLTLTNLGKESLALDLYTKGDSAFSIEASTVQLDSDTVVTVFFNPSELTDYLGSLVVDAGTGGRVEIALSGTGATETQGGDDSGTQTDDSDAPDPSGPDIEVTPSTYDFGQVDVGGASSTSFTVYNNGTDALLVSNLSFGDNVFSNIGGSLQLPQSIDPGKNKSFVVEFAPTQQKNYSSWVKIASDDPDELNVQVTLEGEGVDLCNICQPIMEVDNGTGDISTLGFGVLAGITTDTKTITLTNTGDQDLDVTDVGITNDGSCGNFVLQGWNGSKTVSPGRSTNFEIKWTANTTCFDLDLSALGLNVLEIISNDPGNSPFKMGLSGVAL